ncbi:MAG: hypothetical protein ACI4BC_02145, partial [Muribaculaceae bacterium]
MKFVVIILICFIYLPCWGQISSYKPIPLVKKDTIAQAPYDSLYTFHRNRLHSLIGQEIQFLPCEHDKRNGSYNWFALYHHCVIYKEGVTYGSTRYDALVNKKFRIVGVDSIVDDNLYFREVKYRFRVTSTEFTDTMSLSLPVLHDPKKLGKLKSYRDFDPFSFRNLIILGFYEKLKQRLVNTTVTIKYSNNKYSDGENILYDLTSGAPLISTPKGKKLTVKDIGVIDGLEY